jgi:soluble lytic murein transglycosylase-like protein
MKGRWALWACAPLLAALAVGAQAQVLQVHVDGSVVVYDGANQRMSKGAHPFGRVISGGQTRSHSHGAGTPAPPPELAQTIRDSADRHQVDAHLVEAVAWQESHYKASARSAKGAQGTMQLMPATARAVGVDATDAKSNVEGGVIYLASMMNRFGGDKEKALAAYNAGPGAVARYGGVPPYRETKAYVSSIMGRLNAPDGPAEEDLTPVKVRMSGLTPDR